MVTPEAIEAAARAWAIHRETDGCFERVDAWEALEEWEREAHPDEYPESDYEDCATYRSFATAALTAAAPFIAAQAKGEAFQAVRDAAEVEPDQVGDYGMVELPGYLIIDTRAFDALDKDDRERLHITADDYAQAIDDARAQAKVEALREAAEKLWPESLTDAVPRTEADRTARVIAVKLRRRAATIETEAS